jgi:hypothetical protein
MNEGAQSALDTILGQPRSSKQLAFIGMASRSADLRLELKRLALRPEGIMDLMRDTLGRWVFGAIDLDGQEHLFTRPIRLTESYEVSHKKYWLDKEGNAVPCSVHKFDAYKITGSTDYYEAFDRMHRLGYVRVVVSDNYVEYDTNYGTTGRPSPLTSAQRVWLRDKAIETGRIVLDGDTDREVEL